MSLQAYNSATDTLTPIAENDYKDSLEKVSALPTASADLLNKCYLLTANQGSYVKGGIYQCQSDGSSGYVWILINGSGVPVDVIEDGNMNAVTSNAVADEFATLGTASVKDATDLVRPGVHDLVESGAVYSAINNAVSSIYTPRGSLTCAELTNSLLVDANVGNVYEMSDAGTTTSLFIQGAGETISIGDNVGVIKAGANTYLFNLMGNAFDLTDYAKKPSSSITNNLASLDANGNLADSGKKTSDFVNNYNYSMTGTSDAEADIKVLINTLDSLSDNGTYAGQFIRIGYAAGTYTASMFKDSYHKYVEGVVTSASNDFTVVKDTLLSTGVSTYYIKELSAYKYLGGARGTGTSGGIAIGNILHTWTLLIPSSNVDVNTNYFTYDSTTGDFTVKKAGKYKVTFYIRYSDNTSSLLCDRNNNIALTIYKGSIGKYHESGGSDWMVLDPHSGNARLSQMTEWVIDCAVNETISVGGYTDNAVENASCWAYHLDIEKVG